MGMDLVRMNYEIRVLTWLLAELSWKYGEHSHVYHDLDNGDSSVTSNPSDADAWLQCGYD